MNKKTEHLCTCCCMDCIEGRHCGGAENDHGICFYPVEENEVEYMLEDDFQEEDE